MMDHSRALFLRAFLIALVSQRVAWGFLSVSFHRTGSAVESLRSPSSCFSSSALFLAASKKKQKKKKRPTTGNAASVGGFGAKTVSTSDTKIIGTSTSEPTRAQKESSLPATVLLKRSDYTPPAYWVTRAFLQVNIPDNLETSKVEITSTLTVQRNLQSTQEQEWLVLDGDYSVLTLQKIAWVSESTTVQRRELVPDQDYQIDVTTNQLRVRMDSTVDSTHNDLDSQLLETVVQLNSLDKQELSGLFRPRTRTSNGNMVPSSVLLTHCEPIGFRQITFFPDRPDNTCIFTIRIEANQQDFPLLLSNGELIESGTLPEHNNQRHFVVYHDPHPKPSYLFALLASTECAVLKDTYQTESGQSIDINIYCPDYPITHGTEKLQFAMKTVQKAMVWDEQEYGLEYDASVFNIVAIQAFALGAMENSHLNFFQTSLIATSPQITSDVTYDLVMKTIAHEYFHNWSGNRVSIRDWFEFTLKEGLTVFRDQEFSASEGLRTIARIEAVKILKEKQFQQDASPDRRPIRPEEMQVEMSTSSYLDTLASPTSYHKGAEVCRMYQTILGKELFREGATLYFDGHKDGHGATCDDFLQAMSDTGAKHNHDFADHAAQFALWYSTPGTPIVTYTYSYDPASQSLCLTLSQSLSHTGQDSTVLYIPIAVGLLDLVDGTEVRPTAILHMTKAQQIFRFDNLERDVVPSILRGFSAPVMLQSSNEDPVAQLERMAFLAAHDTDGYNRWEAMQQLYTKCLMDILNEEESQEKTISFILQAFQRTLQNDSIDHATKSYLLMMPSESAISRQLEHQNPQGVHKARCELGQRICSEFHDELKELYEELTISVLAGDEPRMDAMSRAERTLRNSLLDFLCFTTDDKSRESAAEIAMQHLDDAKCFTDKFVAFQKLSSMSGVADSKRMEASKKFHQYAIDVGDAMVLNKWFQAQSLSNHPNVLDHVQQLTRHPQFKATNVGQFRSLISSFTMNANAFHSEEGYKFIGSVISQMDRVAPTLAVELANKFANWKRYRTCDLMKAELVRIASSKTLSPTLAAAIKRMLH